MRLRLLTLMLLGMPLWCIAQERARPDMKQELWASVSIQGRPAFLDSLLGTTIAKRIRPSAEVGYRSADSFFAGRQYYADLGIAYKVTDKITVGTEFRHAYRTNGSDRQRLGGMVQYKTKVRRFELAYRFTYQHNFREWGDVREVLRNKFIAGYNIPKWKLDPQFSTEFFTWAAPQGLSYYGTRYKLGTEWDINKVHSLGIGVVHDRERMVFAPEYRFILSVDYGINLRKS